ncbi:MAG: hypothetical protein NTV30_02100 [Chloroflexi bacterium]|nr:hypothetical protein [Chloroflexota bacterium]
MGVQYDIFETGADAPVYPITNAYPKQARPGRQAPRLPGNNKTTGLAYKAGAIPICMRDDKVGCSSLPGYRQYKQDGEQMLPATHTIRL